VSKGSPVAFSLAGLMLDVISFAAASSYYLDSLPEISPYLTATKFLVFCHIAFSGVFDAMFLYSF
jgi:hypothetical protein